MSPRLNREDFVKLPLLGPLRKLRKRSGLSLADLQDAPEVIAALEQRVGRSLNAEEAVKALMDCIDELPASDNRAAMIHALNVEQKDLRDITTRRSDYATMVVYKGVRTVQNWEDDGFRELALKLSLMPGVGEAEYIGMKTREISVAYQLDRDRRIEAAQAVVDVEAIEDDLDVVALYVTDDDIELRADFGTRLDHVVTNESLAGRIFIFEIPVIDGGQAHRLGITIHHQDTNASATAALDPLTVVENYRAEIRYHPTDTRSRDVYAYRLPPNSDQMIVKPVAAGGFSTLLYEWERPQPHELRYLSWQIPVARTDA
ncbi:MAG: hypothetical protein CYG59_22855 [Chloroflexi bacterium]|nr:MAG: hypothetical protein CYG59_22855 [Chloroflexota bacterium]